MQWSNLNEQMIEEFFQNSNSPSNAQISLNFTRTSRQMGSNQKPTKDISPRLEISHPPHCQKPINPETDIFAFADQQIHHFDEWIENFARKQQNYQSFDQDWEQIQKELLMHESQPKQSSLENAILSKVEQVSKKIVNLSYPKPCSHCIISQKKIFQLQNQLKNLQMTLQAKTFQLNKITEKQVKEIGYELSFEVQNRLLNDRVGELMSQNFQISETLQLKNQELNRLSEEINKLNFEKSNFLSRTKALQTRAQELQKSKSFLMSAAKNSTSHSEFNITNQAMLSKSHNQTNIDTTLIHTNQFSGDRPTADDYCGWFEKLKQVYLQKYKKQEKEHLKKFPELRNNEMGLKMEVNNFKKGSARYEVARSWNNIANYVSKNKENFVQLVWGEVGVAVRIPGVEGGLDNKENVKIVECLEEEVKKEQKKAEGLLSQIENLNSQLLNIKKTLLKEKQQKIKLSRQVDELHEEINQLQHSLQFYSQQQNPKPSQFMLAKNSASQNEIPSMQLLHQLEKNLAELENELSLKSQELKNVIQDFKLQEQSHLKLSQSLKECERLLHKERLDKIQFFNQSLPKQPLTTACRIRAKSIAEKKLPSILHEFESRVYVEKDKVSYKFDLFEQTGKKSTDDIYVMSKKLLTNCLYEPGNSLITSMGSSDSEFREYFRGENGLMWGSVSEMYRLKLNEKRFIHVDIAFSVIEVSSNHVIDMMDCERHKKVAIMKEGDKVNLQSLSKVIFETQQQAKSALNLAYSSQQEANSHIITIVEFIITDKRTRQNFTSKIYFAQVLLQNSSVEYSPAEQNLVKDTEALRNAFKAINFKQSFQADSNRLTSLLSKCLNQNSKNLLIINVSPTELHKQNSLFSLNFALTLKQLPAQKQQKPQSLIRYSQKTPDHSVSKLKHNSSHSLIQTPTLNPDSFDDKTRSITKHRNSSSEHTIYGAETGEKKKRTISRLSIC